MEEMDEDFVTQEFLPAELPAGDFRGYAKTVARCVPGDVFSLVQADGVRLPFVVTGRDSEGFYAIGIVQDSLGTSSVCCVSLDCLWPEETSYFSVVASRVCN